MRCSSVCVDSLHMYMHVPVEGGAGSLGRDRIGTKKGQKSD